MRSGRVDEVAGALRPVVRGETLVALGGGRVIDVAKALAAADPPRRVVAIPTTLSGAEMTPVHRRAAGADPSTPGVRPAVVVNDPALSASQPAEQLAQSAGNALGHAIEGPATPLTNPVAQLAGDRGGAADRPRASRPTRSEMASATRWRSGRCWRATRSAPPATACTTSSRRRSCGSPGSATAPRTRSCCR